MRTVIYNQSQLDTICQEMYNLLKEKKALNVDFFEYSKKRTLKQNGFLFGCIVRAILDFYKEKGDNSWTEQAVCDVLYQCVAPKVKMVRFNGDFYEHSKHISEMDREEMSSFIDNCIKLIDMASCFKGLILHPSIRNTWVNHITEEELKNLDTSKFSRECPEYLEYRRKESCLVCGRYGSQAHHIRESDSSGVGIKANDWETISLCPICQAKYHDTSSEWFKKEIWWILQNISLEQYVAICYQRWLAGYR